MKFLRAGRYGRVVGMQREKPQRVLLSQTYFGCNCVDQQVRQTGTGHRFGNHCEKHGHRWCYVRIDPLPDEEEEDAGAPS